MTEKQTNAAGRTSQESGAVAIAPPETRKERWLKYGVNVGVMSVAAIVLAGLLTYLAQKQDWRVDTTIGGAQSLSPQTVRMISSSKEKVTIVGLYPRLKTESGDQDFYQPVADLLNEYAATGSNISVEMIDPDTQKDQYDKFVKDMSNAYAGDIKSYKALLEDLPAQNEVLTKFAKDELGKFRALPLNEVQDEDLANELNAVLFTLGIIPMQFQELKNTVETDLKQDIPDYKADMDEAKTVYSNVSNLLEAFGKACDSLKNEAKMPKAIRDYAPEASKRSQAPLKTAQAVRERISKLGEMKQLEEFRDQLKSKSIIVESAGGYKIIPFEQVWTPPERNVYTDMEGQSRYNFSGEQRISMAIASLRSPIKRMVVFVRPGGQPLTTSMSGGQAWLSAVAGMLRDNNFEVMEKDASGMSAMQSRMPMPEPTPEQMKSAIWVVLSSPKQELSPEMSGQVGPMLAEHLKEGGSAMVVMPPDADPLTEELAPWGIRVDSDYILVHEALPAPPRQSTDIVDTLERHYQGILLLNQYGKGPLARPLEGFDFLLPFGMPVTPTSKVPPETTVTPLLPIPESPKTWGAKGASVENSDQILHLTGEDLENTPAHPLYAAACAEKAGQGRLVVLGCFWAITDQAVNMPDVDMLERRHVEIARCPGNGEFFMDSIYWLAGMDSMLEISPHSLQMARIKELSPAVLNFWRVGVLTAGLPAAVVLAGLLVFFRRRD